MKKRRRIIKTITQMPFRPILKFLYMYLFKLGFLDGKVGFRFCIMKEYVRANNCVEKIRI
jgi:hypothetical protein